MYSKVSDIQLLNINDTDRSIICVNAVCWALKLPCYLQKTKEHRTEQMHPIHRCILIYDIPMKDLVV